MKAIEPISGLFIFSSGLTHTSLLKLCISQIECQSSTHSNSITGACRCTNAKSTRRGIGRVACGDARVEDRRTIIERGGAGGISCCWLRAVADGHDGSECYTSEGEGDDDGSEHFEWRIMFGMADLG